MRSCSLAFVLFVFTTYFAPPARADPPGQDPHMPSIETNYCPGGQAVFAKIAWCDGQPYADGPFWRQELNTILTLRFSLTCFSDPGSALPPPAPPGGCGGGGLGSQRRQGPRGRAESRGFAAVAATGAA